MDAIEKRVLIKIIELSKKYRESKDPMIEEGLTEIQQIADDLWNERYKSKKKPKKVKKEPVEE